MSRAGEDDSTATVSALYEHVPSVTPLKSVTLELEVENRGRRIPGVNGQPNR